MKYFKIIQLPNLPVGGMALFPFLLLKDKNSSLNRQLMNHELIHFRQQIELLIIPFYILYLLNYLINLIRYHNHMKAYRNILFEREAYENDSNLSYLSERRFAAWTTYLRRM
ncbi:MAG: hypothetical protein Q7U83_15745 [Daejeonella sp.]|nr:hypothetical protein [Daejeonella sp.]